MIRPQPMSKVRIISHSRNVRSVIERLYDLQMLHIIDFRKGEFDIGKPLKEAPAYSQQLIDLRSAISILGIKGQPRAVQNIGAAQKKFEALNKIFKKTATGMESLKAQENKLIEVSRNPLITLGPTKDKVKEYKSLASFIGSVTSPIEHEIASLTENYMLIQKQLQKQIIFALFVPRNIQEQAKEILAQAGFTERELPEIKKEDAEARLSQIRNEAAALQKRLDSIKKNAQFLLDYEFTLSQLNEKAEAPLRFGSSKNTFIATGWVPQDKVGKLQDTLVSITKEKVHIELLPGDDPPTVLKNPRIASNFEFLLNLYSLPRHYEIDPTMLMFITFPLFFGFMLGDVGYGIITLALAMILEKKLGGAKPLIRIMTISSLAAIAFGFVFGEAFGYEFAAHPILNRVHDINTMMMISVLVGVIHVNFGFVLGFINELHHYGIVMSFFKKLSWITLQAGAALIFFNQPLVGAVIALASVAMIIRGEGMKVIEIPGVLSNILSYMRLYAIGLSSVSLAGVVNNMAGGLFAAGGAYMIFGIVILLLGHAVNLMLGLIGPFLQSVRLHYVEFFQKFYEGGGYAYNPFGFVKTGGR